MSHQLTRSSSDRIIGGVCGGIAAFTGLSSGLVRLITVILTFIFGVSIWVYIIAWIILPEEGSRKTGLDSIIKAFKSNGSGGMKNPDDLR